MDTQSNLLRESSVIECNLDVLAIGHFVRCLYTDYLPSEAVVTLEHDSVNSVSAVTVTVTSCDIMT